MRTLLSRQLGKLGLSEDAAPSLEEWRAFLDRVEKTYVDSNEDRYTLERSLMMSSREMHDLYETLARSEQNFKALVERLPDAVFVHRGLRLLYVNPAMVRMLGYSSAEELCAACGAASLEHADDREQLLELAHMRAPGDRVGSRQVQWTTRDGARMQVETTYARIAFDGEPAILVIGRNVTERLAVEEQRRRAEDALRVSEQRYRTIFDGSPLSMILFDAETFRILAVNAAATTLYGHTREELLAMTVPDLKVPEELPQLYARMRDVRSAPEGSSAPWRGTVHHRKKSGACMEMEITSHAMDLDGRRVVLAIARDVTEVRALEAQLRQAQKMESIGRLAGGIAHDFNNLLSVVMSNAEVALEDAGAEAPVAADLREIVRAAERATHLTRQLLAFGRKQILAPKTLDLNQVVTGMEKMLERLLGEDVELTLDCAASLGLVLADPGQIEQVIMNLVVNARDAVAGCGRVCVATSNVWIDHALAQKHPGIPVGAAVRLSVSDDGGGMDEATRARIFEPFFTTKEKGKGTGLGLSTVFGIVQQSGGHVGVRSEPGKGATFEILLPRTDRVIDAPRSIAPAPTGDGTETILLVEDEDAVRAVAATVLRRRGYVVLEAMSPGDALLVCEQHPAPIHLLLTDVMMPRMNGRELAERVVQLRPRTKVLFMSGYTEDTVVRQGVLASGIAFLHKPITPLSLTRKVREVLDEPGDPAPRASLASGTQPAG